MLEELIASPSGVVHASIWCTALPLAGEDADERRAELAGRPYEHSWATDADLPALVADTSCRLCAWEPAARHVLATDDGTGEVFVMFKRSKPAGGPRRRNYSGPEFEAVRQSALETLTRVGRDHGLDVLDCPNRPPVLYGHVSARTAERLAALCATAVVPGQAGTPAAELVEMFYSIRHVTDGTDADLWAAACVLGGD